MTVDSVAGEDHHPADGVANGQELLVLAGGELVKDVLHGDVAAVGRDDRVTTEEELAKVGSVVQVLLRGCLRQGEWLTGRQRLAPQQAVVPAQRRAGLVRVTALRVASEVERHIDHECTSTSSSVLSTPGNRSRAPLSHHWRSRDE